MASYASPVIIDYGSLTDLTAGLDFAGPEDGGSKLEPLPHHS